MTPFIYNLLLFSPLLLVAIGVLYILDRLETQRHAPLPPQPPPPPTVESDAEPETGHEIAEETEIGAEEAEGEGEGEGEAEAEAEGEEEPAPLLPAEPDIPTAAPLRTPSTRTIGPKKARSLARRDQRRAYHEYQHSLAQQRAAAASLVEEEEQATAYENARRRAIAEEAIAMRREAERVERLLREQAVREKEAADVGVVVRALRGQKVVRLSEVAESVGRGLEWVEGVVKREGFLGPGEDGGARMVTRAGVWVCLDRGAVGGLWEILEERGKMEWNEVGDVLGELLVGGE